jgi:hypothetical protein
MTRSMRLADLDGLPPQSTAPLADAFGPVVGY